MRKLACFLTLTVTERDALHSLEQHRHEVAAHADIIHSGDPYDRIFVVFDGWAMRYKTSEDGERVISNFVLPGDFICLNAVLFPTVDYSVSTLTPMTLACFSPEALMRLTAAQPRLALAIAWCGAREESILFEHLVNFGRRTAYQRLAHLLLELWRRLEPLGLADDDGYTLPATQTELADSLGLSLSHVNRTMTRLKSEKLIAVATHSPKAITILDKARLAAAAAFDDDFLHFTEVPDRTARALDGFR